MCEIEESEDCNGQRWEERSREMNWQETTKWREMLERRGKCGAKNVIKHYGISWSLSICNHHELNQKRIQKDSPLTPKRGHFLQKKRWLWTKIKFLSFFSKKVLKLTNILFWDYLGLLSLSLTLNKNFKHNAVA